MLHVIYGRAGSGKTQYVRELLAGRCENGERNLLLLTPEQYSFESERAMLRRLGPRKAQGVQGSQLHPAGGYCIPAGGRHGWPPLG